MKVLTENVPGSVHQEIATSKHVVTITSVFLLALLIWQTLSASFEHQRYQKLLMNSVTDRVISDYLEYFSQLRLEIDLFQQKQINTIESLQKLGKAAEKQDYMPIYEAFKANLNHGRLFSLIDQNGDGILKHITGDFMPACKEEVRTVINSGVQEQLFLHRSKSSVHFDLLQPLATKNGEGRYFFAAFNTDVLQSMLAKYQLPHQELFLIRADKAGAIELTTEVSEYEQMELSKADLDSFSYIKTLPGTRWQLAIRLEPKYSTNMFAWGVFKAFVIWFILSGLIFLFYRSQQRRLLNEQQLNHELQYKDSHDKLTGLVNRKTFDEKLGAHITLLSAQQTQNLGIVVHVDLDKFQLINNSYGFAVGDRILLQLSISLKSYLPNNAILSRLGNDEFAILLPSVEHVEAKKTAHDIRRFIQDIQVAEEERHTNLSASVGVINIGDEPLLTAEQVLASLSLCIRLAKKKGGNRVVVYQGDDPQLRQHAEEMDAIHLITRALKEQRFVLYKQEIRHLTNKYGEKHYEMLVRMEGADGQIIPPNNFIPAAEKYGLIKQIDQLVIEKTLEFMSTQDLDSGYSINLSGTSLGDRDIIEFVHSMFDKYPVNPQRVCFEVTETSAISHLNSALLFMQQMIELGCVFSLDDFGSGLSSFSYLQQLPVSIIKIDGSFIQDIDKNHINRIFVENIQRTAQAMNKKTVAEFVESADIELVLQEIGIDYGQGYHFDKPKPCFN